VVLCPPEGAVGGVAVLGAATGTREIELLRPGTLVERVHAVLLSGGSAFGLAAADGVMRYLEERGIGFAMRSVRVPIVPAAILFDLGIGDPHVRPGPEAGYAACLAASDTELPEGSVGAGTGATIGKGLGSEHATKAGIGSAAVRLPSEDGQDFVVAALMAVNAAGEVVDPETGRIVGGVRDPQGEGFLRAEEVQRQRRQPAPAYPANTVIGLVATNARLSKDQTNRLAQMAGVGIGRAVRPAHTMGDGDVLFALATGTVPFSGNLSLLGAAGAQAVSQAILRAVTEAQGLAGVPAVRDLPWWPAWMAGEWRRALRSQL
jgi:L-aminopeptidase/D-esterase-like protein